MILRRFYITENANGAATSPIFVVLLAHLPDQAPTPRSKVNRVLKTHIHPKP